MSDTHKRYPTRRQALIFNAKAFLLRWQRTLANLGRPVPRHAPQPLTPPGARVVGEAVSALWSDGTPAERALQLGKVENLRRAARHLDGLDLAAGAMLSFWRQVGRPTRRNGFAPGRELRQGCVIPSIGGGLCQLSNGIYQAALQAGLDIVERHPHTQIVPGSHAALGQDATVFWNYIDLRLAAPFAWRLEVRMNAHELRVTILRLDDAPVPAPQRKIAIQAIRASHQEAQGSCDCCGQSACYLNIEASHPTMPPKRSAYLVDVVWPEFEAWVRAQDRSQATLLQSWDGARWGHANYAWPREGWASRRSFAWLAMARAMTMRMLAQQGARRQRATLRFEAALAKAQARHLDPGITHLVVAQPLLPHLQRLGVLGGRRVDVLMVRSPLAALQADLDAAHRAHPQSRTLGDFRADARIVAREAQALAIAQRGITPHRRIAEQLGASASLVDWAAPAHALPPRERAASAPVKIAFLGPTAGRRGAWEARAAFAALIADPALASRVQLIVVGSALEDERFWSAMPIEWRAAGASAFADVDILVTPAWIDHAPRRALQFLAAGRRVLASTAAGLPAHPYLVSVPPGDAAALGVALRTVVAAESANAASD